VKKQLILIALLLASTATFAQKKNDLYYADVAVTRLGLSATYDHKFARHLAVGAGVNVYDWGFGPINTAAAIYADVRPYWRIRRSLLFILADVGLAFYDKNDPPPYSYSSYSDFGVHTALGFGYGYMITRRGAGPYVTLAIRSYSYTEHYNNPFAPRHESGVVDATSVLSVGFKF
jgi:hypothetical protein